jgi:hydrogenase/urease accessory protein HupE
MLFVLLGSPESGTRSPAATAWWSAGLAGAVLVLILFVVASGRPPAAQAMLFGAAAGLAHGFVSAVTSPSPGTSAAGWARS